MILRVLWILLALLPYALLVGCSGLTLPANPTRMDPDQIKQWVKDKTANVGCGFSSNPYGKFNAVYLNLDTGIIPHGTVTIDEQCKVTISNPPLPPRTVAPEFAPGTPPVYIPDPATAPKRRPLIPSQ